MRIRALFTHTLREAPSHAELASHKLLARAGYFQEIGKGAFAVLPLGRRALQQLEQTLLRRLGIPSSRVELPLIEVHEGAGALPDALTFPDPQGRQLQLAASFQISFAALARQHLASYKQLPAYVHVHGPQWAHEVAPASGLLYSRLPEVLELTGFFASSEACHEARADLQEAFQHFLRDLRLECLPAGSASNQAWYAPHPAGRSELFSCAACGYLAAGIAARFTRQSPWQEDPAALEEIATPDCTTIESLARFLNIPKARTAKAIFLSEQQPAGARLVIAVVPGDRELDENRLAQALGVRAFRPAVEAEILASGAVPGYGSPIGTRDATIVVDAQIPLSPNLIAGANRSGYHFRNVNYGRDFQADLVAEITRPKPGDPCPHCSQPLLSQPAVLAAEMTQVDPQHGIMDPQGNIVPLHGLNLRVFTSRLLALIAEANHDEYGLVLPTAAAPFPVHLVLLPDKDGLAAPQAEEIAARLEAAGFEPLFDDRNERAGVKFNDADLIGIPQRITVSQRALAQDKIEWKARSGGEPQQITLEEFLTYLDQ